MANDMKTESREGGLGLGHETFARSTHAKSFSSLHGHDEKSCSQMAISVTLEMVESFEPSISYLDAGNFATVQELYQNNLPSLNLVGKDFNRVRRSSTLVGDDTSKPVFAMQTTFIPNGVLITICLHHCAGDIDILAHVIRRMSNSLEALPRTQQSLAQNAAIESLFRERVTDSEYVQLTLRRSGHGAGEPLPVSSPIGPQSGTCRTVKFKVKRLEMYRDFVNERNSEMYSGQYPTITSLDCLAAILWLATVSLRGGSSSVSSMSGLALTTSIWGSEKRDPTFSGYFNGNTSVSTIITRSTAQLSVPLELGAVARAAWDIREQIGRLYQANNGISTDHARQPNAPQAGQVPDLTLEDWRHLPVDNDATLGLGLGQPAWISKASRSHSSCVYTLLPERKQGVWEVLAEAPESQLAGLLSGGALRGVLLENSDHPQKPCS